MSVKKIALVLSGFVLSVLAAAIFMHQKKTDDPSIKLSKMLSRARVLRDAPPLVLPLQGNEDNYLDLANYRGQVTLVHFFASWCSHCRADHNSILRISSIPNLKIIGINVRDDPERLEKWLKESGNYYHAIGLDKQGETARTWGVVGTPSSFLVDGRGKIVFQHVGKFTPKIIEQELRPCIHRALELLPHSSTTE